MSWVTPTRATLISRMIGYVVNRTQEMVATLYEAWLRDVATAIALIHEDFYAALAYVAKQLTPLHASDNYLLDWGIHLNVPLLVAMKTTGLVTITGVVASTQVSGSIFTSADGTQYQLTAMATIPAGGTVDVAFEALVAGASGNCEDGTTMTLASPSSGIDPTVTIKGDATTGRDEEEEDPYRARMQEQMANPRHGGCRADYVGWARACTTVVCSRAWMVHYPDLAVGLVRVYFVKGNTDGTEDIPTAGEVTLMDTYLQPLNIGGTALTVLAPTAKAVDMVISDLHVLTGYVLADVQAAIEVALAREMRTINVLATAQVLRNSRLRAALDVPGVDYYTLTSIEGGSPTADVSLSAYELPIVGTVTWS